MADQVSNILTDLEIICWKSNFPHKAVSILFSSCEGFVFSLRVCHSTLILLIFNFPNVANEWLVSQKTIFGGTTGSLQPEARSPGHSEKNLRILWQTLARRSGWKCCWRLQDSSALMLTGHGSQPKMEKHSMCSIHSSGGKMRPSRSCCLTLRLGQAVGISSPVAGIKKFCC